MLSISNPFFSGDKFSVSCAHSLDSTEIRGQNLILASTGLTTNTTAPRCQLLADALPVMSPVHQINLVMDKCDYYCSPV